MEVRDRMEVVLNSKEPFKELWALARTFKDEGMTQEKMYQLFDGFRIKHENDLDETKHNAVLDVMDLIVGWCGRSNCLFETDYRP